MLRALCVPTLLGLFISLPYISRSQVVMSGGATMGGAATISGGNISTGSWSDNARRVTIAIGITTVDAHGVKEFTTGAAGVIIRDARNRIFLATALHVFEEPSIGWAPISLQVRGWKDENHDRNQDFGSILPLRQNGRVLYTASRELDLAICPVTQEILNRLLGDDHKIYTVDTSDIARADDTYDGADIFILGFPALVGSKYQQHALMRSGIIAWTDPSGPVAHEFLVDARIFPGNSGGPVFSSAAGMTRDASLSTGKPIKLLGIVSQTVNARPELALGMNVPPGGMIIGAAGVGIIEPARGLLDLMSQVP